ncbi:MAG: ferrous iron transporter B [Firmicutes bacterium]|nr:ferrous iron transporter B [Bacillota bacterium]
MSKKIVLVGNPNVGKSVIFSQLTGTRVVISNYPGTTVEYISGRLKIDQETFALIDAPGTYSLEPTCRAEEVAANLVDAADIIVNVIDATNLERNLYLTSQLLDKNVPMIVVLNMVDEAAQKGIDLNYSRLQYLLGIPVIPTVALSGEGLKELVNALSGSARGGDESLPSNGRLAWEGHVVRVGDKPRAARGSDGKFSSPDERWAWVGSIVGEVQQITHRHRTWLETLELASLKPHTGIPLAAFILFLSFKIIIGLGEFLHELLEHVIFEPFYLPLVESLSLWMGQEGFWHDLLIGTLVQGEIHLEESMGVLTTGVFAIFGVVLPFLVMFYLVLGFLEDCGYLPRLAVIMDRIMHRLGLHGFAVIPMILGLGCNVPAVMAARNLESRRERFLACTLLSITVPCAAQMSMVTGLVGRYGGVYLGVIFATLFFIWIVLGLILDRFLPGYTPSMIMEIPPYRWPHFKSQRQKLGMRLSHFLVEALPFIFGGIVLINLLYILGVTDFLANLFAPVIQGLLGLPREAISTLFVGFLRKDVAVAMLLPLGLSARQFVVGAIILVTYFPCAATFAILSKELGVKGMAVSAAIMIITSLSAGTMLNLLLETVLSPVHLALALVGLGILIAIVGGGTSDRRESAAEAELPLAKEGSDYYFS